MKKIYDGILFDENGDSIPLCADDFTDYLLESLSQLKSENLALKKQLSDIRQFLDPLLYILIADKVLT